MKQLILFVLTLSLLSLSQCSAQVYRYTDTSGRSHYVDSADKVPEAYRSQLKDARPLPAISKESGFRIRSERETPTAKGDITPVEVYVTSWCPHCQRLEAALRKRQIPFRRYDIERNAEGKRKHQQAGGGGVPVTRVGKDTVIRGNNLPAILAALNVR